MSSTRFRAAHQNDWPHISDLLENAFPDEDLKPLVHTLMSKTEGVTPLVAVDQQTLIGLAVFTRCGLERQDVFLCLLGPVAISPNSQRRGIGSRLITFGLDHMRTLGATRVCVLGDPAYYNSFGFTTERHIRTPYPIPQEWNAAWQSLTLSEQATLSGTLSVPPAWKNPQLWS